MYGVWSISRLQRGRGCCASSSETGCSIKRAQLATMWHPWWCRGCYRKVIEKVCCAAVSGNQGSLHVGRGRALDMVGRCFFFFWVSVSQCFFVSLACLVFVLICPMAQPPESGSLDVVLSFCAVCVVSRTTWSILIVCVRVLVRCVLRSPGNAGCIRRLGETGGGSLKA